MNQADEKPLSVTSMEESVRSWPDMFRDLNDGGDTMRWAKEAFEVYAPALLLGQVAGPVTAGAQIAPDQRVTFSFPAFFDNQPSAVSQAGQKVRFHGKLRMGMVCFTESEVAFSHETGAALCLAVSEPVTSVKALNPLAFKLSMLSMTSVGPGYELHLSDNGSSGWIVFRVALTPRDDPQFERILRESLGLAR